MLLCLSHFPLIYSLAADTAQSEEVMGTQSKCWLPYSVLGDCRVEA